MSLYIAQRSLFVKYLEEIMTSLTFFKFKQNITFVAFAYVNIKSIIILENKI